MINILSKIVNSKYYSILLLWMGIIYCFYPVSWFHSSIGIGCLVYLLFNYKALVINKKIVAVSFFAVWILVSALANFDLGFYDNIGLLKKNFYFYFYSLFLVIYFKENTLDKFFDKFLCISVIYTLIGYIEVFSGTRLDKFFLIFRDRDLNPHLPFSETLNRLLAACPKYDPNYVGFLLMLALVMCLFALFKNDDKNILKWIVSSCFFSIGIILTGSRGAILTAVCTSIVFCMLMAIFTHRQHLIKKILVALLLVVIGTGMFSYTMPENIITSKMNALENGALYDRNSSEGMRVAMILAAVDIVKENPLTGLSFIGFREFVRGTSIYSDRFETNPLSDPHNFLLSLAVEGGLPLVVIFFYLIYKMMLKTCERNFVNFHLYKLWILGWMLAFLFNIPFEYSMRDECRFILLYTFFALSVIYCNDTKNEKLLIS